MLRKSFSEKLERQERPVPNQFRKKTDPKTVLRLKRRYRKKHRLLGSNEKPRLAVFRSNKHIYAQVIDDLQQKVLFQASSLMKSAKLDKGYTQDAAEKIGEKIAKLALDQKIKKVVFDTSGYKYHGRIKKLAEAARKGGLKF